MHNPGWLYLVGSNLGCCREVHHSAWPQLSGWMAAKGHYGNAQVQAAFNRRLHRILKKLNRTMVGWDEIADGGSLPTDIVVQSWRGADSLVAASSRGVRSLLSHGYYLDHVQHASSYYMNDPMREMDSDLTKHVLGGEGCMWAELTSSETVESRVWPHMTAIAERLWSTSDTRDPGDMYRRVDAVDMQMHLLGLAHHHINSQRMLQRLAPQEDVAALNVLAETVEPLGLGGRNSPPHYTTLTPLNRFVDAILAESPSARMFNIAAHHYFTQASAGLQSQALNSTRAYLWQRLRRWQATLSQVRPLVRRHPALSEAAGLADALSALSTVAELSLRPTSGDEDIVVKQQQLRVLLGKCIVVCKKAELGFAVLPGFRLLGKLMSLVQQQPPPPPQQEQRQIPSVPAGTASSKDEADVFQVYGDKDLKTHDYSCSGSDSPHVCHFLVEDEKQARSKCEKDSSCTGFVIQKEPEAHGQRSVWFKTGSLQGAALQYESKVDTFVHAKRRQAHDPSET